eukprot:scaffold39715_cov36-Phaeocystis_antarctica.AAC.3
MPARQAVAIQGPWTAKDASHSSETRAAPRGPRRVPTRPLRKGSKLAFKVVSAPAYPPWRRAALIVPRPRWKPSDIPPTQAP